RRHTISKRDWSSDVCSSDLGPCDAQSQDPESSLTPYIPVRPRAQLGSYKRDRHDREGNPDHEADQPSQIPILSRVQLSEDRNEVEDRMHDHGGQVVRDEGPSATHEPGLRETVSENRGRAR